MRIGGRWYCEKCGGLGHRSCPLYPEERMTLTEAADLLGVTPDTLRQQIAAGKLRATKKGRDWHVQPREVDRYRQEHKR